MFFLVVALTISLGIDISVLRGARNVALFRLKFLSILMVVFFTRSSLEVACVQLCRLLARLDLPIHVGKTEACEEYIKTAHNPKFSPVSRQTIARDLLKYFTEKHSKLNESHLRPPHVRPLAPEQPPHMSLEAWRRRRTMRLG